MKKIELVERIERILDKETSLRKENGMYYGEIYVGRDDMYIEDKDTLAKLSEAGEEAIYDFISNCTLDADIYEKGYVEDVIKSNLTKEEFEEYEDDIVDYIMENVQFDLPDGFVWDSEVLVDITITGYDDWNYDFSNNTFYEDDDGLSRLCDGGIKWLIEQQGYSSEEFEDELNAEDIPFTNKFFDTVYDELVNTTTSLNSLVVSTKMTLKELVKLKQAYSQKTFNTLKIDKNCDIGLVDFWLGAGSLLEIQLENDLEIPIENIHEICCDSVYRYNIGNIYGLCDNDYWTEVEYKVI